jgi:hypothetical protein
MLDEMSADSGMGKTTLSIQKLTLKLLFIVFDGDLLPLAALSLIDI